MADDRFEILLKAWGRVYWEEPTREDGERRARNSHPIAQSIEFAPGKKTKRANKVALGRDGRSRRRIVAAAAMIQGLHMVDTAFVDPIRCKETRSFKITTEAPVPPELQKVEQAVKALEGVGSKGLVRALCLRMNYCTEGQHKDKAAAVNEWIRKLTRDPKAKGISVDTFRDELLYGRIWVHGRIYSPQPQQAA